MKNTIKIIALDADDTLWINEPYFQEAEKEFCLLLKDYQSQEYISKELYKTEMENLALYGYGVKGFMLCMIETANKVSNLTISAKIIQNIIQLGQDLLQKPIVLLPKVAETLEQLRSQYTLIVATKGDLLDQERKLKQSGISHLFHHIEIMSDKKTKDYQKILQQMGCEPNQFLMLGNSMTSDIIPVLEIGGFAGHIPYHVTWTHEQHEDDLQHDNLIKLNNVQQILNYLK